MLRGAADAAELALLRTSAPGFHGPMISESKIRPGDGRYLFRGVMVGDGHRGVGTSLRAAQDEAGVPPGIWKGRGLAAVGLAAGDVVTERQASCSWEEGRHPDADRIEREFLAQGKNPSRARRATVLGRPPPTRHHRLMCRLATVSRPRRPVTQSWTPFQVLRLGHGLARCDAVSPPGHRDDQPTNRRAPARRPRSGSVVEAEGMRCRAAQITRLRCQCDRGSCGHD